MPSTLPPSSLNILCLPIELVQEIVQKLDPPSDHPDNHAVLAALNGTSKLLNSLTTWRLYRAPRYRYSNWPLFARTVMLRKELASLVKDLHFQGSPWDDPLAPDNFPEEVAAYYLENYDPKVHYPLTVDDSDDDAEDDPRTTLFTADADEDPDAYIEMAVLLKFCSKSVETVSVNLELCYGGFDILGPPTCLPALKRLRFEYLTEREGLGTSDSDKVTKALIQAASAAPNLAELTLSRVGPENSPVLVNVLLENLTRLVLTCSALSGGEFDRLLSCVPNLRILEYQGQGGGVLEPDEAAAAPQFTIHEAVHAIEENCKKLEFFRLDMSRGDAGPDGWASLLGGESVEDVVSMFGSRGITFLLIE